MMNMKYMKKQSILKGLVATFIMLAIAIPFVVPQFAHADNYDWYDSLESYDDYSFDYYDTGYDYSFDYYEPSYDYSYDYYEPYYGGGYDYGYSTPSYVPSYRPSYSSSYTSPQMPVYVPTQTQSQSQSSNNVNNNVNTNTNVNNVNVVIGTPISGNYTPNYYQNNLDGYCVASPSTVSTNQDVRFTAYPSGGNGNYTYSWSGTDGLFSSSQSFTGRYQYPGSKSVSVTITSNGQSITRSCSVNVDNNNYVSGNNLSVYCVANPTSANVGQNVVWTAYATGGYGYNNGYYNNGYNSGYTYSWTGTDGLSYGNANAIQKVYTTSGTKTATVTVYQNGQSVTASCSANVLGSGTPVSNVTVIRQPTAGSPVSGVYLSQVPDTGIEFNLKVGLFLAGLLIWSAFIGYMMVSRKRNAVSLASTGTIEDKINQFKLANMHKKGLIK